MSGFVTVVVNPCNSSGKVLTEPMAWLERASSSQDRVKPNRPMPTTDGRMIGSTTWRKVCHGVAPRSRAASSSRPSKRLKIAKMRRRPNGRGTVGEDAAVGSLKRENKDGEHRPIQKQHIGGEERRQNIEGP